ncbi:MAG: hypothetical protein IM462_16025 [Microcystis sp. M144S2]|nr:hypothetical protein [Microcystis sp. M034S2]MCA2752001.1 hypothetical protein [Microcystis sp. M144S2]
MSQYILDTDHISLILRNHPQVIANASRHSISFTIITVQELFSGTNHRDTEDTKTDRYYIS